MGASFSSRIAAGCTNLVIEAVAQGHPAATTDADRVPWIRWCAYYGDVAAVRHLLLHGEPLRTLGDNLDLKGARVNHPLPTAWWRSC